MFLNHRIFIHIARVILEMEECAERDMWEFQGIHISPESSGDNDVSLWSSIGNDYDKETYADLVDNPSILNVDNKSNDNWGFLPFMPYAVLDQNGRVPKTIFCFSETDLLMLHCFLWDIWID